MRADTSKSDALLKISVLRFQWGVELFQIPIKNLDSLYTAAKGNFSGTGYRAIRENMYERLFLDR
jgi:hypothetical protein